MTAAVSVLLVPAEGDQHGLLRVPYPGARPPAARASASSTLGGGTRRWRPYLGALDEPAGGSIGLVLQHEGRKVRDGCNRAADALEDSGWSTSLLPRQYHEYRAADFEPAALAKLCQKQGIGRVVYLDAEGREVAL